MKKDLRTDFNNRQHMLSKDFEIYYYSDTNIKNVGDHTHNYYEFYFLIFEGVLDILYFLTGLYQLVIYYL